jgi:hypothetical protein
VVRIPQPGQMLHPFDSRIAPIHIHPVTFSLLIQSRLINQNRASFSFSCGDNGASCSFSELSCSSDI